MSKSFKRKPRQSIPRKDLCVVVRTDLIRGLYFQVYLAFMNKDIHGGGAEVQAQGTTKYDPTHRCSDVQAFAFPSVDHSGWSWLRHRRQCPASIRRWSTSIPAFRRRWWRHRHLPGANFRELSRTENRTRDKLWRRRRLRFPGYRGSRTSISSLQEHDINIYTSVLLILFLLQLLIIP